MINIPYEKYETEYIDSQFEDDDDMFRIREALKELPMAERKIFLMYTEQGTYSSVAKALHCSVPTVSKKIEQIRSKIKNMISNTPNK